MAPSYSKPQPSPWLAGSWRKGDVLWWVGTAIAVPVIGRGVWWLAEKSYNSVTPYQVGNTLVIAVAIAGHAVRDLQLRQRGRSIQACTIPSRHVFAFMHTKAIAFSAFVCLWCSFVWRLLQTACSARHQLWLLEQI